MLDLEKSKPLMQCFFENQLLNQFVKATQKLKDIIVPIQEGLLEKSSENMSCCVDKLKGFLVDETTFAEEFAFYEQLSDQKVKQITLTIQAAKESIDEFKSDRANSGVDMKADDEKEVLTSSLKIVERASHQCIKYGLLCFLRSPDASAVTEQGEQVRQCFKDVWGMHNKSDGIKAYLGDSSVTEIEDILNIIQPMIATQGPKVKRHNN